MLMVFPLIWLAVSDLPAYLSGWENMAGSIRRHLRATVKIPLCDHELERDRWPYLFADEL
jgi:hypothetical protein